MPRDNRIFCLACLPGFLEEINLIKLNLNLSNTMKQQYIAGVARYDDHAGLLVASLISEAKGERLPFGLRC